jgi:hypothetical protein
MPNKLTPKELAEIVELYSADKSSFSWADGDLYCPTSSLYPLAKLGAAAKTYIPAMIAEIAALEAELADAAELHLADESTIYQLEHRIVPEAQKAVEESRRRRGLVEADLKEWQDYWGCEYPHDSHVATNGVLGREQERANLACNEVASLKARLAEESARLDWMDRRLNGFLLMKETALKWRIETGGYAEESVTVRGVIDAAREK